MHRSFINDAACIALQWHVCYWVAFLVILSHGICQSARRIDTRFGVYKFDLLFISQGENAQTISQGMKNSVVVLFLPRLDENSKCKNRQPWPHFLHCSSVKLCYARVDLRYVRQHAWNRQAARVVELVTCLSAVKNGV